MVLNTHLIVYHSLVVLNPHLRLSDYALKEGYVCVRERELLLLLLRSDAAAAL